MKALSIRDIIGPIMIGPSSSHTAGALRIALMCSRLLDAKPVWVNFKLYGSFAHTYQGHGTDRALLAGLMGMKPDDARIRDSFELARQAGIDFRFTPLPDEPCSHPNTVVIEVRDEHENRNTLRGESIGGGAAIISEINGVDVTLTGEYSSLVIKQQDVSGVLAFIAGVLTQRNINIATTRLFREKRGQIAYTVMEIDDEIPADIVAELLSSPDIHEVKIIPSDRASESIPPTPSSKAPDAEGYAAGLAPLEAAALFDELDFASAREMIDFCHAQNLLLSEAICRRERLLLASSGIAVDDTARYLDEALEVMRQSATVPLENPKPSMGGLIGGEAAALVKIRDNKLCGGTLGRAIYYGMAVLETNASMGCIVAAPTAGSSGVLPGVLFALQDELGFSNLELRRALANAAAIGYLVSRNASVSGAEGGCQAEVGSASAMAASAACELFGGTVEMCFAAASNALCGLMGLVCDPIGGLVEAPCQKRNATGIANALVSAQIALSGCTNLVNFDETVDALYAVGKQMPFELRESALGGIAAAPSACAGCKKGCCS